MFSSRFHLKGTYMRSSFKTKIKIQELKYNTVAFFACVAIALPAINKIKISSLIYVSTENISGTDAENIKY